MRCHRSRRYQIAHADDSSEALREIATISLSEWLRRSEAIADVHAIGNGALRRSAGDRANGDGRLARAGGVLPHRRGNERLVDPFGADHSRPRSPWPTRSTPSRIRGSQRWAIGRLCRKDARQKCCSRVRRNCSARTGRAPFATGSCVGAFWDASEEQGNTASITVFLAGGSASVDLHEAAAAGGQCVLSELCCWACSGCQ
jgi:hypothetical protein